MKMPFCVEGWIYLWDSGRKTVARRHQLPVERQGTLPHAGNCRQSFLAICDERNWARDAYDSGITMRVPALLEQNRHAMLILTKAAMPSVPSVVAQRQPLPPGWRFRMT